MSVAAPIQQHPPRSAPAMLKSEDADFAPDADQPPLPFRPWLLCLSVLPFLALPLAHVLSSPQTATGLFHYELPYYVANGRSAFERGNGILYPNSYDPAADAPAIYAHWLPEMLGAATAVGGADPGTLILWLTMAAAIVFAAATRRLVATCLPRESADSAPAFLIVMWGGGLLVTGSLVLGVFSGRPDLLQLDPGNGLWFLNWGRNALFPTEAVYHALVACCWLAEVRNRSWAASVFLLLLATTHPWSGLELLLTINLWRSVQWLRDRCRARAIPLAVSATMLSVFLIYYRIWLPGFEQHAALQRVWELDWSLSWLSAVAAWGPMAVVAGWRLWKDPESRRTPVVQFLLCALVVAVGLSLHDRLIKPVQPLHFTRGYVWLPLCLLGLPVLLQAVRSCRGGSVMSRVVVCSLGLLLISDNLVFGMIHCGRQYQQQDGFHLDVHDRVLLADLHETFLPSVVLTDSAEINYLLPAYSHHRPWLGHRFNTPDWPQRAETMQRCFAKDAVQLDQIPDDVSLLVVRSARDCRSLVVSSEWQNGSPANPDWVIWVRSPPDD